jgi:L-alanine-DL-glutamate epimerase-like enolase superfamily enzyme
VLDAGVAASPHAWGDPLKTLYAAQIGAGLGNVLTVEVVPGTVMGVDTGGYRLDSGRLHVPTTPGFGIPLPDGVQPD